MSQDANLDEDLYRIANVKKGYAGAILDRIKSGMDKLTSPLFKRSADKIVSIYEKGISQKRG